MKQFFMIALMVSAMALCAAEAEVLRCNLKSVNNWHFNGKTAKLDNGVFSFLRDSKIPEWRTGLTALLSVQPEQYYLLSVTAAVENSVAGEKLKLAYLDDTPNNYREFIQTVKNGQKAVYYLCAKSGTKNTNARLLICGNGTPGNMKVAVSGITGEAFDFSKPFVIPAEGEAASSWADNNWGPSDGLALVDCEDHIDGGKAVEITAGKKKQTSIRSFFLPVKPGKKYRISAWFKADKPVVVTSYFYVYANRNDYRADMKKETVSSKWKRLSGEFTTPTAAQKPCMNCGFGNANIAFNNGVASKVWVKDWTIEEVAE